MLLELFAPTERYLTGAPPCKVNGKISVSKRSPFIPSALPTLPKILHGFGEEEGWQGLEIHGDPRWFTWKILLKWLKRTEPWLPWATTGYFIGNPSIKTKKTCRRWSESPTSQSCFNKPLPPPLKHTCATNNAEATDTLGDPGHFIVAEQIA